MQMMVEAVGRSFSKNFWKYPTKDLVKAGFLSFSDTDDNSFGSDYDIDKERVCNG